MISTKRFIWPSQCGAPEKLLQRAGNSGHHHGGGGMELHPPLYIQPPHGEKVKEAFFATDGSDQSMIVMFAPEGCVINGVDSELYDWEEKLPRIEDLTDGMPICFTKDHGQP